LQLGNSTTGAVAINPNNQTGLFVNTMGSVGIGTQTIPANTALFIQKNPLDITNAFSIATNGDTRITGGALCVSADNKCTSDTTLAPGTLYASNHVAIAPADLAENYISSQELEPGDIVMPAGDGNNLAIVKSTTSYQSQIIGVISTKPGVVLNSDAQTDSVHPNKYPIALSGRVPVKVSIVNGVVRTGDLLTSSATPGIAMKATKAGPIIGKALEDFSSQTPGIIMAYISISFGNPNMSLADDGNLNLSDQLLSNLKTDQKNIVVNFINEIANKAEISFENIYSTIINAKQIATDNLTVNKRLLAPIADIAEVHSNVISPLSDTANIAIKITDKSFEIHNTTGNGAAVATIDNQGNASFSGQLASTNLTVHQDATISGTLHAGKILADEIVGLPSASTSAQYITNFVSIASYSGQLANVPSLHVDTATIEQGLVSLGPTSLSDTSITGQLSIGSQFVFADNSINVLNGDLELQPLRQGGVSIAGRQVYIDTNGNMSIQGNEVVTGTFAANLIAPIPNHDLTLKLDNGNLKNPANFTMNNASNAAIFSVSQLGNLIASGEATINKLNFHLTQPALALSTNEVIESGSAGVATISANQSFIKIDNKLVTDKSLIYITAVGNSGQSAFLLKQVPGQSFTVGIAQPSLYKTLFNWLIVN
jgi:hypothetical protein